MLLSFLVVAILTLVNYVKTSSPICTPAFTRPRLFVLSDIANEPDDAQSLIRFLLYSSRFEVEGIVATTSFHLNSSVHPEQMIDIINAYGQSLPNLKVHEKGWPEKDYLLQRVKTGLPVYGMAGVGNGKDSEGSELLISAVDSSDSELWVSIWGGPAVLAQALYNVQSTRSPTAVEQFVQKLRVYAISDQDDSGSWIRRNFPKLFYIVSVHHFTRYGTAAWTGMSGEKYYGFEGGPDSSSIDPGWIHENIQSVGPLGAKYPTPEFIMEGDTPAFLYLIPNGLSDPRRPEWGSWGGRYGPVNFGEGLHSDTVDRVLGKDGHYHSTSQATIWRWRHAYQADFAMRNRWTVAERHSLANHSPVVVINGSCELRAIDIEMSAGEEIILDASDSYDPDGDKISYKWWQYREPSNRKYNMTPLLVLERSDTARVTIKMPELEVLGGYYDERFADGDRFKRDLHVVLEVGDGRVVSYRRLIVHVDIRGQDILRATIKVDKTEPEHNEL